MQIKKLMLGIALCLCIMISSSFAETLSNTDLKPDAKYTSEEQIAAWTTEIERAFEIMQDPNSSSELLDAIRFSLEEKFDESAKALKLDQVKLQPIQNEYNLLGPKSETGEETEELSLQRKDIEERLNTQTARVKRLELINVKSKQALDEIFIIQRDRFTKRLLSRGPSPIFPPYWFLTFKEVKTSAGGLLENAKLRLEERGLRERLFANGPIVSFGVILAILIGFFARRRLLNRVLLWYSEADQTPLTRLIYAFASSAIRLTVSILAILIVRYVVIESGLLAGIGKTLFVNFTTDLIYLTIAYTVSSALFAPEVPKNRFLNQSDSEALKCVRFILFMSVIFTIDNFLQHLGQKLDWSILSLQVLSFITVTIGSYLLFILSRTIYQAVERTESKDTNSYKLARICVQIVTIIAFLAPFIAAAGYFSLSRYLLTRVFESGVVLSVGALLFVAVMEIAGNFFQSKSQEDQKEESDTTDNISTSMLVWLAPLVSGILVLLLVVPVLFLIWGAQVSDLRNAGRTALSGFHIGSLEISLGDVIAFALVFTLGLLAIRFFQRLLRVQVLPFTKLDTGAQASIVAGIGYIGFFLTALLAISATSIDLSNFAVVLGALSVGIGFGLQNVVSNFVSGIILLIERPIRVGDWIVVAGGQGYVKKIKVRSTEIETFDEATLIVPNSDLIAGSVMNWTHNDARGRVKVAIGVAYGTDPHKVRDILLDIINAHPMVLKNPAPNVIFSGFGASSLDFEIRGIIRDVNWVMSVASDINFEIAAKFKEENIEIPFPQRDLNITASEGINAITKAIMNTKDSKND